MIVVCQKCHTRFHVEQGAFRTDPIVARCCKCGHVFAAYRPAHAEQIPFLNPARARTGRWNNVIALSNQKGGVAKTSSCLNLGKSLAMRNKKVLLVDFDAQANLSICLGFRDTPSFYDVIHDSRTQIEDIIVETEDENLHLVPSNQNLVLLNKKYFGARDFELMLKDRLAKVQADYDYILIDTPPSIDLFTLNALTAARLVVIPTQCDYLSTHGVDQILRVIDSVRQRINPDIEARILITMFDAQSPVTRMIRTKIGEMYRGMIFDQEIEMDPAVREAQILGVPVLRYNAESTAGRQYTALAAQIPDSENSNTSCQVPLQARV
jgi:chromosome partitioning protein